MGNAGALAQRGLEPRRVRAVLQHGQSLCYAAVWREAPSDGRGGASMAHARRNTVSQRAHPKHLSSYRPARGSTPIKNRSILQVVHCSAAMPKRLVPKLFGHQKLGNQPEA
jgi:hypothetical protein